MDIPKLCATDSLKPFGSCRLCLVEIEGHTDNVPVAFSERFQSNWDLSAARSASVADYLVGEGYINPEAVTVTGYADTVPIASNDTATGRAQNRRIEITVKGGAG